MLILYLLFLIFAPTQLWVFFQTPTPIFFLNSPEAFPQFSFCLSAGFPVRSFKTWTTSTYLLASIFFANSAFQSPAVSRWPSPVPSPARSTSTYSLLFYMPSKALCSVPFLPLPRVLFDTPGTLMGQSETLSLRISLWLIFITPQSPQAPTPNPSQIYNLCCLQLQMFCSVFYSL